jgi:drug/metabolite transporter (DMT)-like permease
MAERGPEVDSPSRAVSEAARPDATTLSAFAVASLFAGSNAVAIRLGYAELAPFWGAAIRFLCGALILLVVIVATRRELPRGRALTGVTIFGVLNFGLFYICAYWALTEITAGTAMVVLAVAPLLTFVLAVAQRLERFHIRGLVGSLLAACGVVIVFRDNIAVAGLWALLAVLGAALSAAEVNIVVKKFPHVDPVVENALGMAVGGGMLLAVSLALGEDWVVPHEAVTLVSLLYLILFGSIGLFVLYLIVLARWTATATSYVLLVAPLIAVILGAIILDEPVSPSFLVGGILVLAGVYIGAFSSKAQHMQRGRH